MQSQFALYTLIRRKLHLLQQVCGKFGQMCLLTWLLDIQERCLMDPFRPTSRQVCNVNCFKTATLPLCITAHMGGTMLVTASIPRIFPLGCQGTHRIKRLCGLTMGQVIRMRFISDSASDRDLVLSYIHRFSDAHLMRRNHAPHPMGLQNTTSTDVDIMVGVPSSILSQR